MLASMTVCSYIHISYISWIVCLIMELPALWKVSQVHKKCPKLWVLHPHKETRKLGHAQTLLNPNLAKGSLTWLEEFKWGFPSASLSVASNKWWGSTSIDGCEFMFAMRMQKIKRSLRLKN